MGAGALPGALLLWGGFLRIVAIHHTTFMVNSVAHLYGTRPYTEDNSARDNGLLAFLTNGEGYHNFHHKFPSDFRNGMRWYQWGPTKWLIVALRFSGLARDLRKTPKPVIEKSLLQMRLSKAEARLPHVPSPVAERIRPRLQTARNALDRAVELWHEMDTKRRELLARGKTASAELARSWRETQQESRSCLEAARREWRQVARILSRLPEQA